MASSRWGHHGLSREVVEWGVVYSLTRKYHILFNSCSVYPQDYEGAFTTHLSPHLGKLHASPDCGAGSGGRGGVSGA